MASATAAGSAYSTHGEHMIPFYIFYSMFGFQRTGDSIWAMADQLARGFLIGATAGRTTLTGEGLQHADGHSPLLAATNPAVVHYDPAFAYEISHIMQNGLERMYGTGGPDGTARTSSTTSPSTTSRSSSPPSPTTSTSRASCGASTRSRPPRATGPRVQLLASGVGFPWVERGRPAARRGLGRRGRHLVGHVVERARPRRCRRRAVEPAPPGEEPRTAVRHRQARRRPGAGRRGLRLHARGAAADRALGPGRLPRARRRRLRLRRHPPGRPALLPHRRRVASSSRPSRRSPTPARSPVEKVVEAVRSATGSTTRPRSPDVKQEGGDA